MTTAPWLEEVQAEIRKLKNALPAAPIAPAARTTAMRFVGIIAALGAPMPTIIKGTSGGHVTIHGRLLELEWEVTFGDAYAFEANLVATATAEYAAALVVRAAGGDAEWEQVT